ncbi:HAMP domain-containing histidine kinase [Croceicoccus ponticola]|uniref:histidine kinase n=1 Tax=Croceicoccus ponticola TaxID=2217664 RepID=A0A437GY20_9SPHN|nr:HAMP domain-containing sensor histidine kinase [Croceicoccus ponticola]RVQ67071.1 HAMP domain-containing histidine kinase [Croceicoccus ponticola]
MTQVHLLDSIFTRLVAWSIAVCTAVVLILGTLVGAKFEQLSVDMQEAAVNADMATLLDAYRDGGQASLASRIDERLNFRTPSGNAPHYLLVAADGRRVAGDLTDWPGIDTGEMTAIPLPDGSYVHARAVDLPAGQRLLVARESAMDEMVLNEIGIAFVIGGLFVVLAVGVAGRITAGRLSKRVGRINAAFKNPDERRLERLDRDRNAQDEIGELTRHSSEALQRLNRLVDAHRDTLDQIAHEMRTPLMHLDARLLRAIRTAPDDAAAQGLVDARGDIRTVIATLESLLDISHSEANRGDPRGLEPVDLSAMIENIADLYAGSAEETGHRFEVDIAPGVTVRGEEMQLTRLVTNLLDNAFKYTQSGGTVCVELVAEGPVLTVADTGPGVPVEDRDRIFERFIRAKGNHGASGGSGLGLALARAIARRHGLVLRLKPTLRGACFEVRPESTVDAG